jgi:hypothetical protein
MSTAGVFLALCGSSYAAVAAIGSKEVRDGSLTGRDVKDGSLRASDFRARDIPQGERGPAGPPGSAGPQGERGPAGEAGRDGIGRVRYRTSSLSVPPDQRATVIVECEAGEQVIGGGFLHGGGNVVDTQVITNGPLVEGGASGWLVEIRNQDLNNDNSNSLFPDAYAVCAEAPGD